MDPKRLDELRKRETIVVVGIFDDDSSEEAKMFKELAEQHRFDYSFVRLDKKDIKEDTTYGTLGHGIHAYKKFDEGYDQYKGNTTDKEALEKWLLVTSIPFMAEIAPETYEKYSKCGLPMAYLFYEGETMRKEFGAPVEDAMRAFKGKINSVYIDAAKWHSYGKALMLPGTWPGFVIHDMSSGLKYPFQESIITKDNIIKFVESFVAGKLEPSYRSEEIPEKEEGATKTVVYKNWKSIIMDETKDVLLELYAPWCGACQHLAPVYEALAKTYAPHHDKIVIAKMDVTANDLPKDSGVEFTKLPTILLFKANAEGKKQPIKWERTGNTVQAMVDFISANAVNKVDVKVIEPEEKSASGKDEASAENGSKDEL